MNFETVYDILQKDVNYQALLKPLLPYLKKDKTILDAGCGSGYILTYLAKAGYQVTGLDINPNMLALAKQKLDDNKLSNHLYQHDLRKPLHTKFDQIICLLDVLHYFKGVKKVIKNLYDGLNTLGTLIIDLYRDKVNEVESDRYADFDYYWQAATKNQMIYHQLNIINARGQYNYQIKQYLYPVSYYENILKEVGFKVTFLDGFDDRKIYLVCKK